MFAITIRLMLLSYHECLLQSSSLKNYLAMLACSEVIREFNARGDKHTDVKPSIFILDTLLSGHI